MDGIVRILCIDEGQDWLVSVVGALRAATFEYQLVIVPSISRSLSALESESFDIGVAGGSFDDFQSAAPSLPLIRWPSKTTPSLVEAIEQQLGAGMGKAKRTTETELRWARQDRQKKLEAIAAMDRLTASERISRLLEFGARELGHQNALVTDIVGPEATIVEAFSKGDVLRPGLRCPSEYTFCRHVLTSEDPVGIPNIGESFLQDHPARKAFSIESYVACRVSGNPQNQKTLCYVSDEPQPFPPSDDDLEFVRSLAFRIDVELKNRERESELSLTKALFDAFMNNAPIVATLKDAGGVFRYVNRVSDPVLSDWVKGFEGSSDRDVVEDSDFELIRELDVRVLDHGETVQARHPLHIPNHGIRYLHMIKFPVISPNLGRCVGTVSLDVTPQFEAKRQLAMAYEATLEGWTRTLDVRDSETQGHSRRVAELTVKLARRLGTPEEEIVHVWRGALLHDLGKIGIPDAVLNKPGPLSDEEWEIMRRHPKIALDMLTAIPFLSPALDIPYYHHERWDGTGYPEGLSGNQIPRCARIFAVVDVYDALISDRPYREALSQGDALSYIQGVSGTHFDPEVVDEFLKMIAE